MPSPNEGLNMPSRKPISTRARFEIFKRDGFTCQYCGSTPPKAILHVDHIHPVKLGGNNDPDNLITSCDLCNMGKSAIPLTSVPKSLKDKSAEIAEREAQILGYTQIMDAAKERLENDTWRVVEILDPGAPDRGYPRARFASVKNFVSMLGVHEVEDAAEIASDRRGIRSAAAFKYFCGICWNKARGPKE